MGTFPNAEPEIATLATEMAAGLTDHADIYDAPPFAPTVLADVLDGYNHARTAILDAQAAAQAATAAKDAVLKELVSVMKKEIRYAENTVGSESEQLRLIGWSPRRAPSPLQAPGQAGLLTVLRQDEGDVDLGWKAPESGGKPNAYRVVRRERPAGPWQDVATAVETQVSLIDQPRGKEFEYRIIAVNKAGEGEPSNTVVVVL